MALICELNVECRWIGLGGHLFRGFKKNVLKRQVGRLFENRNQGATVGRVLQGIDGNDVQIWQSWLRWRWRRERWFLLLPVSMPASVSEMPRNTQGASKQKEILKKCHDSRLGEKKLQMDFASVHLSVFLLYFSCRYNFSWHARFIEQGAADPGNIKWDILSSQINVFWACKMMTWNNWCGFYATFVSLWIMETFWEDVNTFLVILPFKILQNTLRNIK